MCFLSKRRFRLLHEISFSGSAAMRRVALARPAASKRLRFVAFMVYLPRADSMQQGHPFFKGTAWTRDSPALYVPNISHETDTSNFVMDDKRAPPTASPRPRPDPANLADADDEFVDFNFQRFWDGGRTTSVAASK